ncbi:uncharacterized protein EI90DRAFT_417949 [Cantharellus anzutake]|uniref:uncharacterized protein n=1 Tax=Cantharellus anzutake TaxID=1750568 RepID=UPI001904BFAE|nr:uncharacterized protein EI90DRAFT_417949 [Cantharellus anzutake]KAF8314604.1 hypothetical protein EI90DRAFT_417949 [Cantharellus anzutake]
MRLHCRPSPVFEAPEYEILSGGEPMSAHGPIPSMSSFPSGSVQDSSTTSDDLPKWGRTHATNGPFVRPRQDDFRVAVFSPTPFCTWEVSYRMFIAVSDIYCTTKRFESDFHTKGKILDDNLDANSDADSTLPIHVPWGDWGPRSARLLATGHETFCSIFMNRYIFTRGRVQ